MQSLLYHLVLSLCVVGLLKSAANSTDTTKSYLWGLIQTGKPQVTYEKGYSIDRLFHRREFHAPVTFIPLEVRYGLGFNGGGGKEGKEIRSGWIKFETPLPLFDGGPLSARFGHQLDLDFLKTNLSHFLLKTSWIDLHTGFNFRYSSLFLPEEIPNAEWGAAESSWNIALTTFSPRILELSISNSINLQWYEPWFINFRYTYGLAACKFYRTNKIFAATPTGWGPSVSYAVGIRYILDPGMANRFAVGLEFKHTYTKIDRISDPDDQTPITRFDLANFGLFLTFSAFYGGRRTAGDEGKEYYYHRDYVTARKKLDEFLVQYPNHAKRYRAERLLDDCKRKIPLQLMNEGINFDDRKLADKALDRYLQARGLASDSSVLARIDNRIDKSARLRLRKADVLLAQGQAEAALSLVQQTANFSHRARQVLPHYQAQAFLEGGKKAMENGFYHKALTLFEKAVNTDPDLDIEAENLRYQIAILLVAQANQVQDVTALHLAIQSLETAQTLSGSLGSENERILTELKAKLSAYEERQIQRLVVDRMNRERAALEQIKGKRLTVGMTIPEVQEFLGEPAEIIHKTSARGEDLQLWLYPPLDDRTLQLSFREFILFKIEAL